MKGMILMGRTYIIATASFAFALLILIGGAAIAGPSLKCEEPYYNFGERTEGESVEHTFIIKNVGDAPADMKKLRPSCGCAALIAVQETLAPGDETGVTVKVSLRNERGPYRKGLAITGGGDNQDSLNLTLEGAVTSELYLFPERLELGRVEANKEIVRSVIVAFAQEEPVRITKTMSDVDAMISDVKTLKDGGLYRVTIRVKPMKEKPRIDSRVLLYTDSSKRPMVDIPVTGFVLVDFCPQLRVSLSWPVAPMSQ
jgi:hypothetical protein